MYAIKIGPDDITVDVLVCRAHHNVPHDLLILTGKYDVWFTLPGFMRPDMECSFNSAELDIQTTDREYYVFLIYRVQTPALDHPLLHPSLDGFRVLPKGFSGKVSIHSRHAADQKEAVPLCETPTKFLH